MQQITELKSLFNLKNKEIKSFKKEQIANLTVEQLNSLKTKIQFLSNIEAIRPDVVANLEPDLFKYMNQGQLLAFSTEQFSKLNLNQLIQIPDSYFSRIASDKPNNFTKTQFKDLLSRKDDKTEIIISKIRVELLEANVMIVFLDYFLKNNLQNRISELDYIVFDKIYEYYSALQIGTQRAVYIRSLFNTLVPLLTGEQIKHLAENTASYLCPFLSMPQFQFLTGTQISKIILFGNLSNEHVSWLTQEQTQNLDGTAVNIAIDRFSDEQVHWLTIKQIQNIKDTDIDGHVINSLGKKFSQEQLQQLVEASISKFVLAEVQIADIYVISMQNNGLTVDQINNLVQSLVQELIQAQESTHQTQVLVFAVIDRLSDNISYEQKCQLIQKLSSEQIQKLNSAVLQNLKSEFLQHDDQILLLTKEEIQNLTVDAIGEISLRLSKIQVQCLTEVQIKKLNSGIIAGTIAKLSEMQMRCLTGVQIQELSPELIGRFIINFSPEQLQCLTKIQIQMLNPGEISELIINFSPEQIQYLTRVQIQELSPELTGRFIFSLSSTQLHWLTKIQIQKLNVETINRLIVKLSTEQIQYLTEAQIYALSPETISQLFDDIFSVRMHCLVAREDFLYSLDRDLFRKVLLTCYSIANKIARKKTEEDNKSGFARPDQNAVSFYPSHRFDSIIERLSAEQVKLLQKSQIQLLDDYTIYALSDKLTKEQVQSLMKCQIEFLNMETISKLIDKFCFNQIWYLRQEQIHSLDNADIMKLIDKIQSKDHGEINNDALFKCCEKGLQLSCSQIQSLCNDVIVQLIDYLSAECMLYLTEEQIESLDANTIDRLRNRLSAFNEIATKPEQTWLGQNTNEPSKTKKEKIHPVPVMETNCEEEELEEI